MIITNLVIWQRVAVPDEDQIRVQPGDIIGVHYAARGDQGVVVYEQSGKTATAGVSREQLSQIFSGAIWDSSLPIGVKKTVAIHPSAKRLPALKPATNCCKEIHSLTGMFPLS